MKTFVCYAALVLSLLLPHTLVGQSIKCEVVGVTVSKKRDDSKYGSLGYVPGAVEGIRVYLKVPVGQHIISISEENLPKIVDSKGGEMASKRRSSIRYMTNYSQDRKMAVIPVSSTDLPPAGTTSLNVKGSFTLKVGVATKDETVDLEMKTGAKVKFARRDTEVRRISKGFGKDPSTRVTFRSSVTFENIKEVYAVDANGKETKGRSAGMSSFGFNKKRTYDQSYELPGKQEDIKKIKVVYFNKTEDVKVPVELKFSLGL